MTVQIASVRHLGSNIQQAIFTDIERVAGGNVRRFKLQATGFGMTHHQPLSRAEVNGFIRAWNKLKTEGQLVVTHRDEITLNALALSLR